MLFKTLVSPLLILIPAVSCFYGNQFGGYNPGQYGGGYYPGNSYGGGYPNYYGGGGSGGGYAGGYPGYFGGGGFGFNPLFFAQNNDLNASNFHKNQFDRNTNAAVFSDNVHKKDVDVNHINKDSSTEFFSG